MLKQFLVGLLTFAFVTVQANAATHNSLKSAFDELNYSLQVEWDQKDRDFYNAQVAKFNGQVESLQAQGMTNQELVTFATSHIKDKNLAQEVQSALNLVQVNKLSGNEARKLVLETVAKNYSAGASWAGNGILYGALLVLLIAAAVVGAASGGSSGSVGGEICTDYYDSWGYYWYTDCYYSYY